MPLRLTLLVCFFFCTFTARATGLASAPSQAAVASAHPAATAVGVAILEGGGNAFDAAVAVTAALAVVEPFSSGVGGGGFYLLHRATDSKQVMIDARETAPLAASADMYLDDAGEFVRDRALNGPLAAGIPGIPAALEYLAQNYGSLPLSVTLQPAVDLAGDGFAAGPRYVRLIGFRRSAIMQHAPTAAILLGADGDPKVGDTIVQTDLAATFMLLAERGRAGFYSGDLAAALVSGVRTAGGIWTLDDLSGYRVIERSPVVTTYRDLRIVSAPPPSSGGIVLAQALNILERYELTAMDEFTRRHVIVEAMRRAYRDRAEFLGDPDQFDVPTARLISKAYANEQAVGLSLEEATPSDTLRAVTGAGEGRNTTHFSVIDRQGNRVAATLSINYPFGAAYIPVGTGVLLNNEMDDFSAKSMTPNAYGLVGDEANAIAPGKRPLSSMTPTFLETPERIGILGTPGGSRIITMVLIAALEFAAGEKPAAWVAAKRFHHQFLPDEVRYEKDGLSAAAIADLQRRGHKLREVGRNYGNMHAILWDRRRDEVYAASDPRGEGEATVLPPPGSTLTPAAIETRPLTDHGPANRCVADRARFPRTVVYTQLIAKISRATVTSDEIPQGGPTQRDRVIQRRPDLIGETAITEPADPPRRPRRMDPRSEQRFTRVDVSDSYDDPAIHNKILHRQLAFACPLVQVITGEPRVPRLRPEVAQQFVPLERRPRPQHRAETARVPEAQNTLPAEYDVDVVVGRWRLVYREDTQASGHPQMDDQGAVRGAEQEILRPALECRELPADEFLCEPARHGLAQIAIANDDRRYRLPENMGFDAATGGFDFR
jgi:gamma-glutamyltranspeptidase/glutathione hydrolase